MSQFYIVNESTEDTLATAEQLQDATRLAKKFASQGQPGDLVTVLDEGGKGVCQFVLMPDGTVAKPDVAARVKQ